MSEPAVSRADTTEGRTSREALKFAADVSTPRTAPRTAALHPPLVPCHGELEPDPGCPECGTCTDHDGCVDEQHPLQDGDCEWCGACRDCIKQCEETRDA